MSNRKQFVSDITLSDCDIEVEVDGEECRVVRVELAGKDITYLCSKKIRDEIEKDISEEHLICEHSEHDHGICLDCGLDQNDTIANAAHERAEGDR